MHGYLILLALALVLFRAWRWEVFSATITPTNQISAANMAANWGPGVRNNAAKWMAKTLAPKRMFNADPAANEASWTLGVNAAAAERRYSTKIANVDLGAMANGIATYGQTNYAAAGTNKAAKFAAKTAALAAAESAVLATVINMPKGKGANNENRMLAWSRGMAAFKGKI